MTDENTEHRQTLQAEGWVTQAGRFEVLAITAGNGNGWEFGEDVLRASLSLWDGANCFVDHAWFGGHSVRDLAGVFNSPQWDPVYRGILLELITTGPSGPLVDQLGRELLREGEPKPNVGFSADVYFTSKGRQVVQITRVASLDLVINPARGGAFVRALNHDLASNLANHDLADAGQTGRRLDRDRTPGPSPALPSNLANAQLDRQARQETSSAGADLPEVNPTNQKGENTRMAETQETTEARANADLESLRALLAVQQEQQRLAQEAQAVRLQACQYLLDSGLAASKLPAPMQEHVRKQMQGRIFAASELQQAIDDARELVSSLSGSKAVAGPAIHSVFSSEDQLQAAVEDLFGVPRDDALRTAHVARLSGIRELYLMLTGDDELHGGYYPSRARLATTADFTGLVKNALNKIVANQWSELGRAGYDWWQRVTVQEQFASVNDITGTLMGTVGTLPSVAEGAEYTELAIGDSPETASFTKYGGYIPLTLELIDRDETRKLRAYPRELANAGLRRLSGLVAAIFTANSGVGPAMADGGALFNNTAVTTAGGHANLLTTALSAAEWEVVSAAVYNQPMLIKNAAGLYGSGPKQAINPKYLLVPRALELTAKNILYNPWYAADNRHQANLQQGEPGDVVTVPEWTDSTDWAAACDPRIAPAIYIGTRFGIMPEVFVAGNELSPAVFMNDEHRLKVRHFLAVWVNDFRPLHKSNVAG